MTSAKCGSDQIGRARARDSPIFACKWYRHGRISRHLGWHRHKSADYTGIHVSANRSLPASQLRDVHNRRKKCIQIYIIVMSLKLAAIKHTRARHVSVASSSQSNRSGIDWRGLRSSVNANREYQTRPLSARMFSTCIDFALSRSRSYARARARARM